MGHYFQGYQLIAWYWSVVTACWIFLGIRLYIDFKGLRKVAVYRDVLLVFAQLFHTGYVAMYSVENDWGVNEVEFFGSPELAIKVLKMVWSSILISGAMTVIIKSDLLFLYHDMIAPRKEHPRFFYMILGGWFFVILSFLMLLFWCFFTCRPFHEIWDETSACLWGPNYLYLGWSTHLASEVVLYIIPIIIINGLKNWTFKQKLSAAAMFLVGSVNVLTIVGSISVQAYQRTHYDSNRAELWLDLYTYSQFQTGIYRLTAILIVCMPQLKPFYRLIREMSALFIASLKAKLPRRKSTNNKEESDNKDLEDGTPRRRPIPKEVPVNINVSTLGIGSFRTIKTDGNPAQDNGSRLDGSTGKSYY